MTHPERELLLEIRGRERRVGIRRADAGWEVTIDGRAVHVDADQVGKWTSLLVGPVGQPEGVPDGSEGGASEDGPEGSRAHEEGLGAVLGPPLASHEIAIDDRGGELIVHVDGTAIPVTIRDPRAGWRAHHHDAALASREHKDVRAPMPGRIVKVLVKAGDVVSARQGLVVVEAMKMENELRAPKDGRVVDVRVTEGLSVDANAILITLE